MGHIASMFESLVTIQNILFIIIGVAGGALVSSLPGLTATMTLALIIPFTFSMNATASLLLLGGLYVGAIYGSAIPAILINTPGNPSGIATTFDGYPLNKKGQTETALMASGVGSSSGGIIGAIALLFLSPLLASVALSFGPPQLFWITVFALTIIGTLTSESQLRGFIGGAIGVLIGCIGIAPIGGDVRYTFGLWQLQGGIELVSALIGLFAIPQVLEMVKEEKFRIGKIKPYKHRKGVLKEVIKYAFKRPYLMIRSALIGIIIGIKPGAGGNIAGIISYNEAVRWSKEPEKFGTGILDGVLAPDTATGAEVGGSLIPLLALGIPSAPPTAVLIGALLSHGMIPGPELFSKYGDIVYPFLFGFLIANIVLFFLAIYLPRISSKLVNIPRHFLIPSIVFLCVVGSYSIRNSIFDVYIMVIIGLIGYLLKKFDITAGPLVLGLILGPIMERAMIQSMLLVKSGESIGEVFFGNLISIFLVLLCILALIWPFISKRHSLNSQEGEK